ncbi:TetR/AcrR family transcriptional regulator [Microbacterium hominis]|uniref:TetR/AcrR family transcriptional regulator n=1 Tax=Microbacterium hominis TaxID=162426 RepID=A0A7D4Q467_9MICO|nr:TetR/AcrR family transcriptional regulator [Microbacterium hominis]QKJ20471.1 TetR/AcrR family transcriptional regulator [Microbacterium hominis]
MPKIVDHDERRELIVDATWRLIERGGFESATMREIAAEAGFAHGALQRYFPNKESLLAAAFVRAHTRTNARAADELRDERGLAALRALCLEIMPMRREQVQEARVVVAFWDRAVQNRELWTAHRENASNWRAQMRTFLDQARDDGEIGDDVDPDVVIDQISAMNAGLQIMCLLMPETATQERQIAALDDLIDRLRTRSGAQR